MAKESGPVQSASKKSLKQNKNTGCSIAVLRVHGVHVTRVQLPAPRFSRLWRPQ